MISLHHKMCPIDLKHKNTRFLFVKTSGEDIPVNSKYCNENSTARVNCG